MNAWRSFPPREPREFHRNHPCEATASGSNESTTIESVRHFARARRDVYTRCTESQGTVAISLTRSNYYPEFSEPANNLLAVGPRDGHDSICITPRESFRLWLRQRLNVPRFSSARYRGTFHDRFFNLSWTIPDDDDDDDDDDNGLNQRWLTGGPCPYFPER